MSQDLSRVKLKAPKTTKPSTASKFSGLRPRDQPESDPYAPTTGPEESWVSHYDPNKGSSAEYSTSEYGFYEPTCDSSYSDALSTQVRPDTGPKLPAAEDILTPGDYVGSYKAPTYQPKLAPPPKPKETLITPPKKEDITVQKVQAPVIKPQNSHQSGVENAAYFNIPETQFEAPSPKATNASQSSTGLALRLQHLTKAEVFAVLARFYEELNWDWADDMLPLAQGEKEIWGFLKKDYYAYLEEKAKGREVSILENVWREDGKKLLISGIHNILYFFCGGCGGERAMLGSDERALNMVDVALNGGDITAFPEQKCRLIGINYHGGSGRTAERIRAWKAHVENQERMAREMRPPLRRFPPPFY